MKNLDIPQKPSVTDIPSGKVEEKELGRDIFPKTPADEDKPKITTSQGDGNNTKHGEKRLAERGFSEEKKEDIKNNYSRKVYQEGGKVVYAKKNGNYYDAIIENADGETITAVGGNKGVEGAYGFEAVDHYHILNPDCTNKKIDYYLDIDGNPVGKGSRASHIVIKGEG